MRGLIHSDKVDIDYILLSETISTKSFIFQGIAGLTNIVFNTKTKSWDLVSRKKPNIGKIGFLNDYLAILPLGSHSWFLSEDFNVINFGGNITQLIKTKLKITKVSLKTSPVIVKMVHTYWNH